MTALIKTYILDEPDIYVEQTTMSLNGFDTLVFNVDDNTRIEFDCDERHALMFTEKINFAVFEYYKRKIKSIELTIDAYRMNTHISEETRNRMVSALQTKITDIKVRFANYYEAEQEW